MKNYLVIIFAVLITVSALTGCADKTANSVMDQTAAPANEDASETISANVSDYENYTKAYKKLIAYKTGDYGQQSIADFHAALAPTPDELLEVLAAMADVTAGISPDDENYDFLTTTMNLTTNELYCEHMGEEVTFISYLSKKNRPCDYLDDEGETVYDFICYVTLYVPYAIHSPKLVTVAERDRTLLTLKEEMQNYLDGLSEAEIAGCDFKKRLTEKAEELVKSLSTERMELLPCEVKVEIFGEAEGGN